MHQTQNEYVSRVLNQVMIFIC